MGNSERLVLIVEENGFIQEIISYLIESKGFKAVLAKDCRDALAMLRDKKIVERLEFAVIDSQENSEAQNFVQEMQESFPSLYQSLPILFARQPMHS